MLLNSADAYNDAKKLLEERFGNPFVLANAYRLKLDNWRVIHGTDHNGLREFSDYLRQCRVAIKSIPSLSVLNDCHENRKLQEKIPAWLRQKWAKIVAKHRVKTSEILDLVCLQNLFRLKQKSCATR